MRPPKKVLLWIKQLLDSPEKWGQGKFDTSARHCVITATNVVVSGDSEIDMRKRFAIYNAILRAADVKRPERVDAAVLAWNDETTHEKLMTAFDKAIEEAP